MFYLCLGFSIVWLCHLAYLLTIDNHTRQLRRRLNARAEASRHEG